MSAHEQQLQWIQRYADGLASAAEVVQLQAALEDDPDLRNRFLDYMNLDVALEAVAAGCAAECEASAVELSANSARQRRRTLTAVAAMAAAVLVAFIVWQGGGSVPATAAVTALERMIEVVGQPIDRVYRIRVTDPGAGGAAPVLSGQGGRKPGVDGAELYLRGSDKFVLVRYFGNGTKFITGSDGTVGWAAAPKGHVHLSHDTRRFRRGMPGEHEEIPFLDLKAGFGELRRGYTLDLTTADDADGQTKGWRQLVAVKASSRRPGPERVQVSFDAAGVAQRIELAGLTPDEAGPRGVALELIEQRDLGPDFFKHESHHEPDRPLDWE